MYLSPDQAAQLLQDLEQDKKVQEDLEGLWCDGQLAVLKKALTAAVELGTGLLEATELVEPDPISPNESTSYSNLYHCEPGRSVSLYRYGYKADRPGHGEGC